MLALHTCNAQDTAFANILAKAKHAYLGSILVIRMSKMYSINVMLNSIQRETVKLRNVMSHDVFLQGYKSVGYSSKLM